MHSRGSGIDSAPREEPAQSSLSQTATLPGGSDRRSGPENRSYPTLAINYSSRFPLHGPERAQAIAFNDPPYTTKATFRSPCRACFTWASTRASSSNASIVNSSGPSGLTFDELALDVGVKHLRIGVGGRNPRPYLLDAGSQWSDGKSGHDR